MYRMRDFGDGLIFPFLKLQNIKNIEYKKNVTSTNEFYATRQPLNFTPKSKKNHKLFDFFKYFEYNNYRKKMRYHRNVAYRSIKYLKIKIHL